MRRKDIEVEDRSELATRLADPIRVYRETRPRPSRLRPRPARIDGLKVRIIDTATASGADLDRVLKLLAKLMVRAHQHAGDQTAIIPVSRPSSTLTVVPNPRPDHDSNNEAA